MARDLTDQIIIITGASAGIGAATAVEAAKAGMHVVLAARRLDRLKAVAREVEQTGRQTLAIETDVADEAAVRRMVDQTVERFGRVDVMFANAGVGYLTGTETMDRQRERQMWEVNYFGTMHCLRAVLPLMRQQRSGHLVITSSIVGRIGLPYHTAYSATKSAQDTMAMGLRLEVEPFGIEVTTVHPITTRTEFFDVSAAVNGQADGAHHTPKGPMQTPQHVARRVIAALRKPIPEVWPHRLSRIGAGLALLMPGMTRRALRKHANKDRKTLTKLNRPLY